MRQLFSLRATKAIQPASSHGVPALAVPPRHSRSLQLSKLLQLRGVCSRRKAQELLARGLVRVNGAKGHRQMVVTSDSKVKITSPKQVVKYYQKNAKVWKFYKPRGCVCDRKDAIGRKTIFQYLEGADGVNLSHLFVVGRLDFNSEGLILLTDNPVLGEILSSRESRLEKRYRVRVNGRMSEKKIEILEKDGLLRAKV